MALLCRWRHHGSMKPYRNPLQDAIRLAAQQRVQRTLYLAGRLEAAAAIDHRIASLLREAAQELRALVEG
jgi:hypothetical protein